MNRYFKLPQQYDLPPYSTLPHIVMRPASLKETLIDAALAGYGSEKVFSFALSGDDDWDELSKSLERFFEFPSSVEHSLDAMEDWVTDLSWLKRKSFVLLLDISKLSSSAGKIYSAIDALIASTIKGSVEDDYPSVMIVIMV